MAELEEQVRRLCRRGEDAAPRCPSGLPALDAALAGGFATRAIHEFLTPHDGSAAHSVALLTAANAAGRHGWVLYIDTTRDFYPPAAAQLGVALGRLLVTHTPRQADALWVGEQALRCRGVAAVVLPLRHVDAYASRRLQLAAEHGGGLGLLIRERPDHAQRGHDALDPTFAASRLRCEPLVGDTDVRRIQITVLKLREGKPPEPFVVELPDAASVMPAHAVSVERPGASRRSAAAG